MGEGLIVRRGGGGKPEGANVWIVKNLKHQYSAEIAAYALLSTSTGHHYKIKEAVQGETLTVYYGNSYTYDQTTGQFTVETPMVTTFELSETGTAITVGQYFTIGSPTAEVMYCLSGSGSSAVFVYDEGYLFAKYNSSSGSLKFEKHFALQYTDTENPRYLVANNEDKFLSDGILDEKQYYRYENENIHGRYFESAIVSPRYCSAEIDGKLYCISKNGKNYTNLAEVYLGDEGIITNIYPIGHTATTLCKHKNKIYLLSGTSCLCFDPTTKEFTTVGVLDDTTNNLYEPNIVSIDDVLYVFGSYDISFCEWQYISEDDGVTWTRADTSDELCFYHSYWVARSIQFVACGTFFIVGGYDGTYGETDTMLLFDTFNKKFMTISNLRLPVCVDLGNAVCKGDTDTVYYVPYAKSVLYKLDWDTFTWTAMKTLESVQYGAVLFNNRYATMTTDADIEYILEDALI